MARLGCVARRPARGLTLTDHTKEYGTLIVTGPNSRALFERLETQADLTAPWLTHQAATVAGRQCTLVRVSFAGELGWEIHAASADIGPLYRAVTDAGAKPFGMYALNALRIEKGYRTWKGDLSTDYTLFEATLSVSSSWTNHRISPASKRCGLSNSAARPDALSP